MLHNIDVWALACLTLVHAILISAAGVAWAQARRRASHGADGVVAFGAEDGPEAQKRRTVVLMECRVQLSDYRREERWAFGIECVAIVLGCICTIWLLRSLLTSNVGIWEKVAGGGGLAIDVTVGQRAWRSLKATRQAIHELLDRMCGLIR